MAKKLENFIGDMRGGLGLLQGLLFGFKLDYTFEQFVEIEKVFMERYPNGTASPATCVFIGYVLGETMVKNIKGAAWTNLESEHIWDMEVEFPLKGRDEKMKFATASRAHNCSLNSDDRMTLIFWMADMFGKYTTDELLAQGQPVGDGWYSFPNGAILRLVVTEVMPKDKLRDNLKAKDLKSMVVDENGKLTQQQVQSKHTPEERERRKNWN